VFDCYPLTSDFWPLAPCAVFFLSDPSQTH